MDSNVSKKTFLHKFFKLGLDSEKNSLSVKELLKQMLLSALDLARQNLSFPTDPPFTSQSLGSKIVLLHSSIESISSSRQTDQVLLTSKLSPIVYGSPIALVIASYGKKKPGLVAEELSNLLVSSPSEIDRQSDLILFTRIAKSGWINFYLENKSIASWLETSLNSISLIPAVDATSSLAIDSSSYQTDLFPAQYVHARCCSLLRLAQREKLSIATHKSSIACWLDAENNFCLQETIELLLLRQIFLAADSFPQESSNWRRLALNLSEILALFLSECRFLGRVKHRTPQKTIARLKLIALTRYWLGRILVEKLQIAAPTSL